MTVNPPGRDSKIQIEKKNSADFLIERPEIKNRGPNPVQRKPRDQNSVQFVTKLLTNLVLGEKPLFRNEFSESISSNEITFFHNLASSKFTILEFCASRSRLAVAIR